MKKTLFFAISLMFAMASCTNEALNEVAEEPIVPESTIATVLYAFFESNEVETKTGFTYDGAGHYDHYWTTGDHIYVFPKEDLYDIYNCTDASKGEFTLLKDRTGSVSATDKVYAVYCSEIGDDGKVIDDGWANLYNTATPYLDIPFSGGYTVVGPDKNGAYGYNNVMVAAADNVGDKLVFKSVVGWLKLQLMGNKKVKSIRFEGRPNNFYDGGMGQMYVMTPAGTPSVDYENGLTDKVRVLNIDSPYAQLNNITTTDFYITLPPCILSQGFSVTINFSDGTSNTINTANRSYEIKRNTVTAMPVVVLNTASYNNLSTSEKANTYIVQNSGLYCFNATKKGNSDESVGTPVRAAVLWESFNTTTTPNVGDVVNGVIIQNGVVYFNVPFTNKGNAVIAVYDSSDNILWSWLIWINNIDGLNTPTDLTAFASGFYMMKASIGAMTIGDRGLYYQWGRKDPFYHPSLGGADIKATHAQAASKGRTTMAGSIMNPTTFYYASTASPTYVWESTASTSLWDNDTKTVNDPCPPGWKVISSSKINAAIVNENFQSGSGGSTVFGTYSCLILDPSGNFSYSAGQNRYWTSNAYTSGGGWYVSNSIKVDGLTLSVADDTGNSAGYQVRCEKM